MRESYAQEWSMKANGAFVEWKENRPILPVELRSSLPETSSYERSERTECINVLMLRREKFRSVKVRE